VPLFVSSYRINRMSLLHSSITLGSSVETQYFVSHTKQSRSAYQLRNHYSNDVSFLIPTFANFPDFRINPDLLNMKLEDYATGKLLLVNKPYKWTSFDVVGKIRNAFKPLKLKVGHAGTLDPLATGLLIICTGKMTKQIDSFQAQEKEYTGTFTLGATTPTYDLESEVDQTFDISNITEAQLYEACKPFIGDIQQYPPAHSAIKIDGERLYEKARRGEEVELRLRNVTISEFELTRVELPEVDFRVVCSKGTYIRSLANDFGKTLNNGAYLSRLRRTRSGNFNVTDAHEVMELVTSIRDLKATEQAPEE
jgi:tRNA pseudouridine55 synthase